MANEDTTDDSSCTLTVKQPKLVFTKGLEDGTVKEGNKILLSIEVNAPPKTVKW